MYHVTFDSLEVCMVQIALDNSFKLYTIYDQYEVSTHVFYNNVQKKGYTNRDYLIAQSAENYHP